MSYIHFEVTIGKLCDEPRDFYGIEISWFDVDEYEDKTKRIGFYRRKHNRPVSPVLSAMMKSNVYAGMNRENAGKYNPQYQYWNNIINETKKENK